MNLHEAKRGEAGDLCSRVAGRVAGGILADWGAEVIKLEQLQGDPMRKLFGALSGSKEERCPPFDLYNHGKKSIALDVNQPDGGAIAQRLVASADVFITNMRPQFLQRVGLDPESLLARHPKLIYASLTAYGLEGPDRDAPGFDMAAFSGRSGIAGALFHRERTGQRQLVSTSLLRTASTASEWTWPRASGWAASRRRCRAHGRRTR